MSEKHAGTQRWKMATVIGVSVLLGAVLAPMPGLSHVGGTVKHLWTKHIRPKADVRYSTIHTELPANCTSLDAFGSAYEKIADLGDFEKSSGATSVEVTFDGRLRVGSLTSSFGAIFELRVDDLPGTGRGRALVKSDEVNTESVQASFTGLFEGLSPGTHTVSIWVRAGGSGTGTEAMWDPGCWSSDKVLIRESR